MGSAVAIVSGSDEKFFELLKGLVCSIRDKEQGRAIDFCIFDLGLTEAQRRWLLVQGAVIRAPKWPFRREASIVVRGLVARSRIPEYFPGHEIYVWVDADAWIQNWRGVEAYVAGAMQSGFCATAELDRAYALGRVIATHRQLFTSFPKEIVEQLLFKPIINAGVFAGRRDAPHWEAWSRRIGERVDLPLDRGLDFYLDQTALNVVVNIDELPTAILPASYNWLCHWALPAVSGDGAVLLHPFAPFEALNVVHLTAQTKQSFHRLQSPTGGALSRPLAYQAPSRLPPDDYVGPGMATILPDPCFPHLTAGDKHSGQWPFFRKGIPHRCYMDARAPQWNFVNRDEALILYNTALRFRGKNALEIGGFLGWSSVHLALGGVVLDIIDPLLEDASVASSLKESLNAAKLVAPVTMIPGRSPTAIEERARRGRERWSLFFIDGSRDDPAPMQDAMVCDRYAEADALVLFHNLAAPAVAKGFAHFKRQGWNLRIYHTAQIMGAAWRGNVRPVDHRPDPRVDWPVPDHLRELIED